jgi:hypothetical protein
VAVAVAGLAVAGVAVAIPPPSHLHPSSSSLSSSSPSFSLPHQSVNPLFISIKPIKPFKQQQKAHMSTENIQNLK